ncbi:Beta-sarcoglycan [Eumeta japonica]|uniref:Beta-sarcoglycan n=1 Tax=Eumeta variegata TaxID=151549 RepID=A0A4C1V1K4_EUMVA|nr:Beta-sarcoglycan [Eumeta japonica]
MLSNLRGASPLSETMSEGYLDRNRAEKALITKTPASQILINKTHTSGLKNYSDKNGNEITKTTHKGRKTFAFWTLVCLLFILAIGNLILTFTILAVLRLGQGMESLEFLPDQNAMKFFGETYFEHIYKRDGLVESFRDTPMTMESEDGSVNFNLQTRQGRTDSKLVVNSSGVFIHGVSSMDLVDPDSGETLFSTSAKEMNIPDGVNVLQAKMVSTKRISSPTDEDLSFKSDSSIHIRGAEGTHMETKELFWSADQDIRLKSINGSIVLSGKEGVFVDIKYLPIALPLNRTDSKITGQFKVCVCMPQESSRRTGSRIDAHPLDLGCLQTKNYTLHWPVAVEDHRSLDRARHGGRASHRHDLFDNRRRERTYALYLCAAPLVPASSKSSLLEE